MARGSFYTTSRIGPKQSLTPEGFLLCEDVPLARTGMMIYGPDETPVEAGPDGVTRIFREAGELFRPETIASALGKSVTDDHPEDDVKPESWKELSHGMTLNVRRGEGAYDDLLLADLLITTPEGIEAVRSGKREVSMGYEADYTKTAPGVGMQSDIIINHVALVEQGRCGPRCAISDHKPANLKGNNMKTNRVLDALMRAFKAKDSSEVEEIAKSVTDEGILGETTAEGATHIHIHNGGAGAPSTKDEDPEEAVKSTDSELAAFVEKNDSEHAEMRSRIEALEKALAAKTTGDAVDPEGEMPSEAMDEIPEELRENAAKAKDSAYLEDSFKDTVAMAEILVPGIRVPTFDRSHKPGTSFKKLCSFRRQALDLAYAQPDTRGLVDDILNGKALDTKSMTCDAVRTLFRAASAAKRVANNGAMSSGRVHDHTAQGHKPNVVMTLAELNRRNKARYDGK